MAWKPAIDKPLSTATSCPRVGVKTPRGGPGSSTPRSVRSATPTHMTDDEENNENLPSYMRPTAASMKKRKESNGGISYSFNDRGNQYNPMHRNHEKSGSTVGEGIIPKGYDPGRLSPAPSGRSSSRASGRMSPPLAKRPSTPVKDKASSQKSRPSPPERAAIASADNSSDIASKKATTPRTGKMSPPPSGKSTKAASRMAKKASGEVQTTAPGKTQPSSTHTPSPKPTVTTKSGPRKDGSETAPVVIVDAAVDLDKDTAHEAATDDTVSSDAGKPTPTATGEKASSEHSSAVKSMRKLFSCITPSRKSVVYE